tara:strand:+ start:111 stop:428 length:318 start_codon:yes stop_codon:yes gene_type:complete
MGIGFRMKGAPYKIDNTPIYHVDMEGDPVMGKANKCGSIIINEDLDPKEIPAVIAHEKVHIDQMRRGDLDYDDDNVYWKGKKYPRSKMNEGAKNLPWEVEAYKNA